MALAESRPRARTRRTRRVPGLESIRRLGLLCAGLAAGCAHYQAAPLDPAASAAEFAARRISDVKLSPDLANLMPEAERAWPPTTWDRAQLLAVAWTRNPALEVARAQVRAASAHEITAAERPNPDLTLQSEYARNDAYPWLYGIEAGWLLRSSKQRRLERGIAGIETANRQLELMDQAWAVRSALAASLCEWESARRRLDLTVRLATAQDQLVTLEKQRVGAGEDAPVELLATEQARIQIEQQSAALRQAVASAQADTAKALGLPPEALDGVALAWPEWGDPPPVSGDAERRAREQALLSRADLGVAIGEYSAADSKLKLEIQRQYPELELGPGFYWDHGIAKFPFDVGFTVPMNGNKGEIAEARAGRELAGRRMLALQADIYGQIAAAERAESIARSSAEAAVRQVETANQQRDRASLGLRLGAIGSDEQLAVEIVALHAELELTDIRARLQSSRNALEDALRAPLSGPELALAKPLPQLAVSAP
jgi:outer membrane protein TolC